MTNEQMVVSEKVILACGGPDAYAQLFVALNDRIQPCLKGLDTRYCSVQRLFHDLKANVWDTEVLCNVDELDEHAARNAAFLSNVHPDYAYLAARILVSRLRRHTPARFSEAIFMLAEKDDRMFAPSFIALVRAHHKVLDAAIVQDRDFLFQYFGYITLSHSYLFRDAETDKIIERPQYMYMRVALAIHGENLSAVLEAYELMSTHRYTHATPTLFNAGTSRQQLSSCFLMQIKGDSIRGIFDSVSDTAQLSKYSGGLGISVHHIRAKGTRIHQGSGGTSNGLVPMLGVFQSTAAYVDQGGGKRKGSFAIYLEPWHADIEDYLVLKLNTGKEENRLRGLFYALWVSDLFMERVDQDMDWSLFCPTKAPGLAKVHGQDFRALYTRYETEGRANKVVRARELWNMLLTSQIETGMPYMLYKDACNARSNQQHLGTIQSSNLCTEIVLYTSPEEIAVCNLASINLASFVVVSAETAKFDFRELYRVTRIATRNLDRVIDVNYYPLPETERSNQCHRPIGLGVQGFADMLFKLRLPFDSPETSLLNRQIFETMYFGALEMSIELAKRDGPHESYPGSPLSQGKLQFDLWNEQRPPEQKVVLDPTLQWDWSGLRKNLARYGARHCVLIALMPTASTSHIFGMNEAFEPVHSNLYARRVLSGNFMLVNHNLVRELVARGLWDEAMANELMEMRGSVKDISRIPPEIRSIYRTAYELSQRTVLDLAIGRAPFVDQSQSMNVFMDNPTPAALTSMHFYGWRGGLKTGLYYLKSKPKVDAVAFTVQPKFTLHHEEEEEPKPVENEAVAGLCKRRRVHQPAKQEEEEEECIVCQG